MPTVDVRPARVDAIVQPGNAHSLEFTWPTALAPRTFTATLSTATPTSLTVGVVGAVVTVSLTEAQTAALTEATWWKLTETTGGGTQDRIVGKVVPNARGTGSTVATATVVETAASIAVTVLGEPGPTGPAGALRIEDEGTTVVATASGINFAGAGVTVTDAGSNEALVTIPGGGGGSGDVATDALWDAAGDLALGTGANTAARLPKGAEGTFLRAGAVTAAWAALVDADIPAAIARDSEVAAGYQPLDPDLTALAGAGNSAVLAATTASFLTADETKLDGIEAGADVTDAANVDAAGAVMNADTSTAAMQFVVDEDNMASDSATKVPTQQSTKAYVDTGLAPKAPLASPALTGTPTAPTAAANTNTTQVATTAYVQTEVTDEVTRADAAYVALTGAQTVAGVKTFSSDPLIPDEAYDATAWNGVLEPPTKNAVRDKIETLAPLASPTFTGNVVVPDADAATEALNRQTGDARYIQHTELVVAVAEPALVDGTVWIALPGPDIIPPLVPSNLTGQPQDTVSALSWDANQEEDLLGYRIRRDGATTIADEVDLPAGTQVYLDTGRTNGVEYDYEIAAVDVDLNVSAWSSVVSVTPAVQPFDPGTLTNKILRLKASTIAQADASAVTSWTDAAGPFSFVQATGTKQPKYYSTDVAKIINGKPVVGFDGGDFLRYVGTLTVGTQGAVIAVVRPTASTASAIFHSADEGGATNFWSFGIDTNKLRITQRNNDTQDTIDTPAASMPTNGVRAVEVSSNGSAWTLYINNTSQSLTTVAGSNTGDWLGDTTLRDSVVVGNFLRNTEGTFFTGEIAEIIVVSAPLSAGERTSLYGYILSEYGV